VKVRGFELAAIKRNTYNDHGNKKNQVVYLEAACFVSNLKRAQHISLGCAPREFYYSVLKEEY
jgi:metal-dependent HD superfamily phosphatase/phosphodiesterase